MKKLIICTIISLMAFSSIDAKEKKIHPKAKKAAFTSIQVLTNWYTDDYKLNTTSWWNAANAVTSIIRYSKITGDTTYLSVIDNVFEYNKNYYEKDSTGVNKLIATNFINDYYDDEGWWALAWIDAYNLTGKAKYLDMAEIIFADLLTGYDQTCGGGIFWKKPKQYKNAIANGLFIVTAFRLNKAKPSHRVNGATYAEWAERVGMWYYKSGMLNTSAWLIEDGLKNDCLPNSGQNWTYNQGVAIAALGEAYEMTNDRQWLDIADKIAVSVMEKMVYPSGVLKEKNEPKLNSDGTQFKGIFMRHLGYLYSLNPKDEYKQFILKNARSIWNNARNAESGELGAVWEGPVGTPNASTHSSALDCLIEAMKIH